MTAKLVIQSRYMKIKTRLLNQIGKKQLKTGDKVKSENQLADEFGVSRMTARRAISELVSEGVLMRAQGIGTFVAEPEKAPAVVAIPDLVGEIMQSPQQYSNQLLGRGLINANSVQSQWLGVSVGSELLSIKVVHNRDNKAVLLEDILINPSVLSEVTASNLTPALLEQDFSQVSPAHFIEQLAAATHLEHCVEAILPSDKLASVLQLTSSQACLKVGRKTFVGESISSFTRAYYAGNGYKIGSNFD